MHQGLAAPRLTDGSRLDAADEAHSGRSYGNKLAGVLQDMAITSDGDAVLAGMLLSIDETHGDLATVSP